MKEIILLLAALFLIPISIYSHEEPAKTQKEKQERDVERMKVAKKKIKRITVWDVTLEKGKTYGTKKKHMVNEYDKKGNYVAVTVFKNADTVDLKVLYSYDSLNNLIGDADYDASGKLLERNEYKLDSSGCVNEIFSYKTANSDSLMGWCEYKKYPADKKIVFCKYNEWNNVEYRLTYEYDTDIKNGNAVVLTKTDNSEKKQMIVKNIFNQAGQRTQKIVMEGNGKEIFHFDYTFSAGKLIQINKVLENKKSEFTQIFSYDKNENITSVITLGEDGKIKKKLEYSYEYH